ncbi:MAG: hypothetical protein M1833_006283 [Piccolia ochrophora]|nr:MAG: hypothetical protein M1833_006283 [Piccolia ochrophora]
MLGMAEERLLRSPHQDEDLLPPKHLERRKAFRLHHLACATPFIIYCTSLIVLAKNTPKPWSVLDGGSRDCNRPLTWYDYTFSINLGTDNIRFAAAKSIDISFDLLIARGGQCLSAAFAYYVFRAALQRIMETSSTTYGLFAAFQFDGVSVTLLWDLLRDFHKHRSRRTYLILIWTMISTLWILFYSTLAGAMTGYTAVGQDVVPLPNGTSIPDMEYVEDAYGKQPDECDTVPPTDYNASSVFFKYSFDRDFDTGEFIILDEIPLQPPLLNLTSSRYNCSGYSISTEWWSSGRTCKTGLDYSWGFSYILLMTFLGGNMIWSFGMYIMWLDAVHRSEIIRYGRDPGKYRTVLDLAEAIQEDLGSNLDAYSDKDLDRNLLAQKRMIKYYATSPAENSKELPRIGLSSSSSERVVLKRNVLYGKTQTKETP